MELEMDREKGRGTEEGSGGIWGGLFDVLALRARSADPIRPEDYRGEDGFWYCGVCRTPKETAVESAVLGRRVVPCLCACGQRRRDREEARRQAAASYRPADPERKKGGAVFRNPVWAGCRFEGAADSTPLRRCRRYAEHFDEVSGRGLGMILFGPPGTGKSFGAACVVNALGDRGLRCLMTNFSRIVNEQPEPESRAGYFDGFGEWDLLVIDDFLSERQTDYMMEIVYNVVDLRCSLRRPLILTTNLNGTDLKNPGTPALKRIMSRLLERCVCVPVLGADRRSRNTEHDELLRLLDG